MATTKPDSGVEVRHEGTVESVYAGDSGVDRLKPNAIGLWGVIFVGVTGAAPISAMLFNVPFATGFGTGLYTPAAFLFATIILTIFTIGYVAMARKMRAAGGFYTFISHGLGRELGLAAGITGAIAYALFEVSLLGGFSYFAATNFNDWFGWEIPWIAFALFAAILISVLCYFHVELSVKVLGAALIGEVIILAIFDLVVFGSGGSEANGIQFESLNMFQLTDPGPGLAAGVGLFLAFWSWVGFEAIPNYAEESKNPEKIVPRATLISVVALGIGYVITSLAFVSAFPENELIKDRGQRRQPAVLPGHGAVRQRVLQGPHAGADPHRLVRVRDGLPQRDHALLLRDGPRGHPAQGARQDAPQVQVGVRGEHHADRRRARARAGLGHRLGLQLRRLSRHRLCPHLHDDGRPGRGVAARHPGGVRAGGAGVAPAPQAPGQLAGRGPVPDHRDRRPGVRDLPAVQEHRRARRHDRLRRPDRPDRDHRRRRSASATRSCSSGRTARSSTRSAA